MEALDSRASQPASATDPWQAWDSFLEATSDSGFMQSSWWADFRAATGYEHFAVILKNRSGIVGGAVVLKLSYAAGRCFYYVPEGPVLPADEGVADEVFQAILQEIDNRRKTEAEAVSHLRIEPRWQRLPSFVSGFRTPPFCDGYMEPRNTLCIDLRPAEAAILGQMKKKGRYNIHLAQRRGVSVVEDTSKQGLGDFMVIYEDTASRQGFAPKPAEYFHKLVSLLSLHGRGSLYFAEHQGRRLAALLVVRFGPRATSFFGGTLAEDRRVMATYLLHFEAMRRAKAMGCDWYDFWGVAPQNEPDHSWQDFSVFKRKFGGVDVHLVPTLDYVYDRAAYDEYGGMRSG